MKTKGTTVFGSILLWLVFIANAALTAYAVVSNLEPIKSFFQLLGQTADFKTVLSQLGVKGCIALGSVVVLFFSPLLWVMAFRSQAKHRVTGRFIGLVLLTALTAGVYYLIAAFYINQKEHINTVFTLLNMPNYELYAIIIFFVMVLVSLLMILAILSNSRVLGILSGIGMLLFVDCCGYLVYQVAMLNNSTLNVLNTSIGMLGEALVRQGTDLNVVQLASLPQLNPHLDLHRFSLISYSVLGYAILYLLGKMFCLFGVCSRDAKVMR